MQITRTAPVTVAAVAILTATAALTPSAAAQSNTGTYSNQNGNVRCESYQVGGETKTICVSDTARTTQPECNPPEQLIPAVSISRGFTGTLCWNQGFTGQPKKLNPLQVQRFGSAFIVPGFTGELYVFDTANIALVRAGSTNSVIWKLQR